MCVCVQVSNYDQLQKRSQELIQDLANTEKKLLTYKQRSSESQRIIRELRLSVPRPARELEALKKELDEIRRTRQREVAAMEANNRKLRQQLVVQSEHSIALQKKLDDQMVELFSAQREVEDLHSLLEQVKPKRIIKKTPLRYAV